MISRRSFFSLVAGAIVAARAPRIAAAETPVPTLAEYAPELDRWADMMRPMFQLGDVVTFGRDPLRWTVIEVYPPGDRALVRLQPEGDQRAAAGRDTQNSRLRPVRGATFNRSHPRIPRLSS